MKSKLWDLSKEFLSENKGLVGGAIALSIIGKGMGTLVAPKHLAEIFTSMNSPRLLKRNITIFLSSFAIEKTAETSSHFMRHKVEPLLTKFLTEKIVKGVFEKYEITNKPIDIAITMEKIREIRSVLEDLMYYIFFSLIPLMVVLVIGIISILKINKKLGIVVLVCVLILCIVFYMLPPTVSSINTKDSVYEKIEDIFNNVEMISGTDNGVKTAISDINEKVNLYYKCRKKNVNGTSKNQIIGYTTSFILYASTIAYLYKLYHNKEISIKDFESQILTIGKLFETIYSLAYYIPNWIRNVNRYKCCRLWVDELFSHKPRCNKNIKELKNSDIEFKNIDLDFNGNKIFNNLSIKIPCNKLVALYGTSGSGKTTFTNLIRDIAQPENGEILIGERKVSDMSKKCINELITNVQQNTSSLLNCTIYSNIAYGKEKTPKLRKYVEALIQKYKLGIVFGNKPFLDTIVEKRGTSLSGGQKAIIHLLHCILNNKSKIMILDEPTSALDSVSKINVKKLIVDIKNYGKTVIVITHDRSLRNICDKVINFKKGSNPKY